MWETWLVSHRFPAVRQRMLLDPQFQLSAHKILPRYRYHKEGAVIIRELLKKGSIPSMTFCRLVDVDTWDRLLDTNVFTFHKQSGDLL